MRSEDRLDQYPTGRERDFQDPVSILSREPKGGPLVVD